MAIVLAGTSQSSSSRDAVREVLNGAMAPEKLEELDAQLADPKNKNVVDAADKVLGGGGDQTGEGSETGTQDKETVMGRFKELLNDILGGMGISPVLISAVLGAMEQAAGDKAKDQAEGKEQPEQDPAAKDKVAAAAKEQEEAQARETGEEAASGVEKGSLVAADGKHVNAPPQIETPPELTKEDQAVIDGNEDIADRAKEEEQIHIDGPLGQILGGAGMTVLMEAIGGFSSAINGAPGDYGIQDLGVNNGAVLASVDSGISAPPPTPDTGIDRGGGGLAA